MCDAGLIVITAFISPFRLEREMARSLFEKNDFKEIYISTPLKVAEKRDPKGLYKKARQGKIPNFTGIDSIYEKPTNPELEIDLPSQEIRRPNGAVIKFEIDPFRKKCLLEGLDDIGITMQKSSDIKKFETKMSHERPWL